MKFSASCDKVSDQPEYLVVEENGARRQVRVGEKFTRDFGVLESFSCESAKIVEAVQRSENDWIRYEMVKARFI